MYITTRHLCTPRMSPDRFEWHTHENFEIYYMLSGAGRFLIGQESYAIYPGTLLILRPDEEHRAVIKSSQPYERIAVHFSAQVLRPVDPELRLLAPFTDRPCGKQNLYNCKNCDITFIEKCLQYIDTLVDTNYNDSLTLRISLYPILMEINRAFRKNALCETAEEGRNAIPQILDYIHLNLNRDLSKSTLCALFFISPSHLSREFKKATGQTLRDYICEQRLTAADRMLRAGFPAAEAAARSGFKDYSSFFRSYRSRFGSSPQQRRKRTDPSLAEDGEQGR